MIVLVVDDSKTNRMLLRAVLESEGCDVLEAVDGQEALELLECAKVDAVISDILMPRIDGYQLCCEIRNHRKLRTLPVIFYTATNVSRRDEKRAREVGANRFLRKPASSGDIITALLELASRSK
ncbi:MAG: response regulator [candidate division NC10 bacterium]|nr:response regulator [candidate division NC10 bacterium]